jgi:hypothetical protein
LKRLSGVIIAAVLLILGSLFQLLMAVLTGFSAFVVHDGLPHATNSRVPTAQPAWLPWFLLAISAVCVGLAAWGIITSVGLFRMRRWARYSVQIIGGTLLVFGIPGMLMMFVLTDAPLPTPAGVDPAQAHAMQFVQKILFIEVELFYAAISAIGIWWLVYFNRKAVREAFTGASGSPALSRRPILITILAVLNFTGALMCTLMAMMPIPFGIFGLILHGWPKSFTLLTFAILIAVAGVGLWRLQEWGRRLVIALQCVNFFNFLFFLVRPSVLQHYQEEVNRSMNIPQPQQFPAHFQSTIQIVSFAVGMLMILAIFAVLHYYRSAFKQPPSPAPPQPELIG